MVTRLKVAMRFSYSSINALWQESRKLGVLGQLYRECLDDWRLWKCVLAYAKCVGEVRNAKLVRLLGRVFAWVRIRVSEAYRQAHSTLRALSRRGKFGFGVCGSAGLRGRLLHFYLDLKNGSAPAALLIDLYI